jgi:exodeoxyribonuclease V alpha subunit
VEELIGKISGTLFANKGTGYTVVRVILEKGNSKAVVNGVFPDITLDNGVKAKFCGVWGNHPTYGRQFTASACEIIPEKGRTGVMTYLINNVKSIGPVTAGKLYTAFGDDLVSILDNTPERLSECDFLTTQQRQSIQTEWKKSSEQRTVSIFLADFGLNGTQIRSVYSTFGARATELIKANPYCLYECSGIGFSTADQVAKKLGIGRDDLRRVSALIIYSMDELSRSDGHTYVVSEDIFNQTKKLFRQGLESFSHGDYLSESAYYTCLTELKKSGVIVSNGTKLYLKNNWIFESEAARHVSDLLKSGAPSFGDLDEILSSFEERRNIKLSDEQRDAFFMLKKFRVCVISGYPGTGKTTLVSAFVDLFEKKNLDYFLLSPTGIAAKRLSQVTGKVASTIHRALGYNRDGGWKFGANNKFYADAIIVDEMSMVDSETFYRLMTALTPSTVVILVGDAAQLPSVGAGYVLNSLLSCPDVPHVFLKRIYRQSDQSDIISVAHQILAGSDIDLSFRQKSQFVFMRYSLEAVVEEVCKLTALMKEKGSNFQLIAPKYDGQLGVNNLNKSLRPVLNPEFASKRAAYIKHGTSDLYEGDRVMIIKNDYDRMIFNGDTGKVQRISLKDDEVEVRVFNWFDQESSVPRYVDKVFTFSVEECRMMLTVAYACTAHRCQGQEFDYVIMPMTMQYGIMLYRNLVYTAITRAKKKVFLFGDPDAFLFSVKNERETMRNSDLSLLISTGLDVDQASGFP